MADDDVLQAGTTTSSPLPPPYFSSSRTLRADIATQQAVEMIDIAADANWFAPLLASTETIHHYDWTFYVKRSWVVRSLELSGTIEQMLRVFALEIHAEAIAARYPDVSEFIALGMSDGVRGVDGVGWNEDGRQQMTRLATDLNMPATDAQLLWASLCVMLPLSSWID